MHTITDQLQEPLLHDQLLISTMLKFCHTQVLGNARLLDFPHHRMLFLLTTKTYLIHNILNNFSNDPGKFKRSLGTGAPMI